MQAIMSWFPKDREIPISKSMIFNRMCWRIDVL